ncbi:MAG: hypothetical protein ACNA7Q_13045 [Rhodobacterales bacterium]
MKQARTNRNGDPFTLSRRAFMGSCAALALVGHAAPALASSSPVRTASTAQTRSIHSGHSLTDTYLVTGPWPGAMRAMGESMGMRRAYHNIIKSTIPGSPMGWRWNNAVNDLRPGDPTADARRDIADFDTLVITEGGPPARVDLPSGIADIAGSLDYLCRFAANAIENGNGGQGATDIILWSIWPSLTMWRPERPVYANNWQEFPDFRSALPEYGHSFRFMADYATWKLKGIYPALPADWRIWLFPGHLWMTRVWDDIAAGNVPGITDMQEFFLDDIHPNAIGGYGLACLVLTCMYQTDLRTLRRLHTEAGVSPQLREYFTTLAWDIASGYAPVGMNGDMDRAPVWDSSTMDDPLPGWSPETKIR